MKEAFCEADERDFYHLQGLLPAECLVSASMHDIYSIPLY